jgi:hypothetical protein
MKTSPHHAWGRWVLALIAVLCVVVVVVRQPLTRSATRRSLSKIEGYRADFLDARVSFLPLSYTVTRLKLVPDDRSLPIFYIERLHTGLFFRDLLRGRLRAWANLDHAKMTFFLIPIVIPDIAAILRQVMPFEVSRAQLKDGEVTVVLRHQRHADENRPEGRGPQLWFHGIEATIEGMSTRAELAEGATTLALRCAVQHSGRLDVFVTVDLLASKGLTFSGQTDLRGLDLRDMEPLLARAEIKASGTFDLLARFTSKDGRLSGGLQPVLKNAKVESLGEDLGTKLKASLADKAIQLASDRVPGRNAVATVVPIHGTRDNPKLEAWPAVLGVMRNAFVEGLSESLSKLPPPEPSPETPHSTGRAAPVEARSR